MTGGTVKCLEWWWCATNPILTNGEKLAFSGLTPKYNVRISVIWEAPLGQKKPVFRWFGCLYGIPPGCLSGERMAKWNEIVGMVQNMQERLLPQKENRASGSEKRSFWQLLQFIWSQIGSTYVWVISILPWDIELKALCRHLHACQFFVTTWSCSEANYTTMHQLYLDPWGRFQAHLKNIYPKWSSMQHSVSVWQILELEL